ncbi:cation:proton antiporter [bacterium]|nr:cation:proton antiporter [bacterium]
MDLFHMINDFFGGLLLSPLLYAGIIILASFYFGKVMNLIRLPVIIGYMLMGVFLGPSFMNFVNPQVQGNMSFITDMALGFVALSIGLELSFRSLKKLGKGIIGIIFTESFGAFILVFTALYITTKNLPLSLIFASVAPASAPAGTVAVIREYKAKGKLTSALYAVVGFDDGLAIIIFGFSAAIARSILLHHTGADDSGLFTMLLLPLKEVFLSIFTGALLSLIFSYLCRKLKNPGDFLILTVAFVFVTTGLSRLLHLSVILTNMIVGITIINTQKTTIVSKISQQLIVLMPILFILFFSLAGSNLHISALPKLGVIGIVYILARSIGLISGAWVGATIGKVEAKIKNNIGLGILSQAGVAIGLALIIKSEFAGLGLPVELFGKTVSEGDLIGSVILTTVTATSIFFEIIGPILTKIALKRAGEIN